MRGVATGSQSFFNVLGTRRYIGIELTSLSTELVVAWAVLIALLTGTTVSFQRFLLEQCP